MQPHPLIPARGNIIRNNYVKNCLSNCYISKAHNNIITGNVFSKAYSYPNIMVEKSNYLIITGNQIIESTGYRNITTSELIVSHGIYLSGTEGCVVKGNVVAENAEHGIKTRFSSDLTADKYNTISGNVCYHNGLGVPGYPSRGTGIFLQGKTEYHSIMGNAVYNNTGNGIRVQADDVYPAIHNLVVGNVAVCHSSPGSDAPISVVDTTNNLYPAGRNVTYTL